MIPSHDGEDSSATQLDDSRLIEGNSDLVSPYEPAGVESPGHARNRSQPFVSRKRSLHLRHIVGRTDNPLVGLPDSGAEESTYQTAASEFGTHGGKTMETKTHTSSQEELSKKSTDSASLVVVARQTPRPRIVSGRNNCDSFHTAEAAVPVNSSSNTATENKLPSRLVQGKVASKAFRAIAFKPGKAIAAAKSPSRNDSINPGVVSPTKPGVSEDSRTLASSGSFVSPTISTRVMVPDAKEQRAEGIATAKKRAGEEVRTGRGSREFHSEVVCMNAGCNWGSATRREAARTRQG